MSETHMKTSSDICSQCDTDQEEGVEPSIYDLSGTCHHFGSNFEQHSNFGDKITSSSSRSYILGLFLRRKYIQRSIYETILILGSAFEF